MAVHPSRSANGGFGPVLRGLRKGTGLSQAAFAGQIGSTQRHVSFLETGRAQPSTFMIDRIARALALPVAARLGLYEAAGLPSPYKRRDFDSHEIAEALDVIEHRVLAHWPFPAYVLNKRWDILRMNVTGRMFLAGSAQDPGNDIPNLFEILTSAAFRNRILNWPEAAPILATRLYREAREDAGLADLLARATDAGLFDGIDQALLTDIPIFVPVELEGPAGERLRLTSLLGQLASVQDAIIEGMTVELMVPLDRDTENRMRSIHPDARPAAGSKIPEPV